MAVLAGEISTILLSAKVSTTLRETDDDAAPMTTDGLLATRVWAEAELTDMSVESPESWMSWQAVMSVPAALISDTARPTPEISGGPRKARLPVRGRMPPTRKALLLSWLPLHLSLVKVSAGALDSDSVGAADSEGVLESVADGVLLSSDPQAARDRASTAVPAMTLAQVTGLVRLTGGTFLSGARITAATIRGLVSEVTVNRQCCGTAHRTLSLANRYVNRRHGEPGTGFSPPLWTVFWADSRGSGDKPRADR